MSTSKQHAEWLSLTTISGAFLSLPVLQKVFPQGLIKHDAEKSARLRLALEEWKNNNELRRPDTAIHRAFCDYILNEILEYQPRLLLSGVDIPQQIRENSYFVPDYVLAKPDEEPRLLIKFLPPEQDLEKPFSINGTSKTSSPATLMQELLKQTGVRLGLVTNGKRWMSVHAKAGEAGGFIAWETELFLDEKITLRAFRSLLSLERFYGVAEENTLAAMLDESKDNQQDLTDQLGEQVRHAIEVLMRSFEQMEDGTPEDINPLEDIAEKEIYEAAITVLMRLVILLRVEDSEEDLFGVKASEVYQKNYAVAPLREQLQYIADQHGEEILERKYDAWCRLLATFRAVFGGVNHEMFQLLPHGGDLFDSDRFPFLEGRFSSMSAEEEANAKPLLVSNRVVLHLLNALQVQQMKGISGTVEALKLNFSSLDVERIGNIYEGLLDHTARRAETDLIEIVGKDQPIISLDILETERDKGTDKLVNFLKDLTKRTANALQNSLLADFDQIDIFELGKLRVACQNDEELYQKAVKYFHLIKLDTRGYPIVIKKGSLYVSAGEDRRSTGTHYTPPNLTSEIVKYTLEPICYEGVAEGKPREEWKLKTAKEILDLKICDVACGSGAFLVQACRYLGERLTEAWDAIETGNKVIITPEGKVSEANISERIIPEDLKERLVTAKRFVADRCLYGVDRNPVAVEMAKISLWLETLQKNKPFTFLDHSIRSGDSLLGITSLNQLEKFSLETGYSQSKLAGAIYEELLKDAVAKRRELESIASENVFEIERKESLLKEAETATKKVRLIADLLIGFSLETAGKRKKVWSTQGKKVAEEIESENLEEVADEEDTLETLVSEVVEYWQKIDLDDDTAFYADNPFRKNPISEIQEQSARLLGGHKPFHWLLEFPEVFIAETNESKTDGSEKENLNSKVGFDAVVSNPPFMGGKKITGNLGTDYRDYLVEFLAKGERGHADLVAYFFLRVMKVIKSKGYAGLVATNTIAQGDTREVGLDQIKANDSMIYRAISSRKWEGTATLEVSFVWLKKSGEWKAKIILDNKRVKRGITPFLTKRTRISGNPRVLKANEGKSFQGSVILGKGFVLTPKQAQELIKADEINRNVLSPYLIGQDLNSRPDQSPSRWVINFFDYPLERIDEKEWNFLSKDDREQQAKLGRVSPKYSKPVARDFPLCFEIILEKVKPQRDKVKRAAYREKWWRFAERCANLYIAIEDHSTVLSSSRVTKYVCHSEVNSCQIFDVGLNVILKEEKFAWQTLESTLYLEWVIDYSSSLETRVRYTLTDCFETFPFPESTEELEQIGEKYHEFRSEIMLNRQEGLTQTYNRFHNPKEHSADIARLRELHIEMDCAVKLAYGWTDEAAAENEGWEELVLAHGFHETKQGIRFTISPEARQEVLDRLLELNFQRHAAEIAQGLWDKKKSGKKKKVPIEESSERKSQKQGSFVFMPEQWDLF